MRCRGKERREGEREREEGENDDDNVKKWGEIALFLFLLFLFLFLSSSAFFGFLDSKPKQNKTKENQEGETNSFWPFHNSQNEKEREKEKREREREKRKKHHFENKFGNRTFLSRKRRKGDRDDPLFHSKEIKHYESEAYPFRVAICYWGATRTLQDTFPSHQKFIHEPLRENKYDFDAFIHNWRSFSGNDKIWTKSILPSNPDDYLIVQPRVGKLEDQDQFKKTVNLSLYFYKHEKKLKSVWTEDVLMNHLLALESLKRVTLLMLGSGVHYDSVIFVRPDVEFTKALPVEQLRHLSPVSIVIPNEDHFEGYNDRFAMGSLPHMIYYALRLNQLHEFRKQYGKINSEKYLRFVLEKHKFEVKRDSNISFILKRPSDFSVDPPKEEAAEKERKKSRVFLSGPRERRSISIR